jgi:catechol 2,3-dioxygenase-like lactoylglutathione lyase family enzyme
MTPTLVEGLHHIPFAVCDLEANLNWWTIAFGAERQRELDHVDKRGNLTAYVVRVPGLELPLLLRLDPNVARSLAGTDLVCFAVATRADLEEWMAKLDSQNLAHSPVLRGYIGWQLAAVTPDRAMVKLYTREAHEWDPGGVDPPWIPR